MSPSDLAADERLDRLSFRGRPLMVRGAGEGHPVGFLSGMLGTPPGHPLLAALAETGYRVTSPCLPGFTGSAPSEDLRTMFDWVVATSEVVDLAGLTGGPVVASSVGAMLALELAAVRPEAFSHLILLAPFGLWSDDDPVGDPFATTLTVQRRLLTVDPEATSSFFDDPVALEGEELVEFGVDRYHTRTASASLVWPIPDHGLSSRIHRVSTPVTVVWGREDQIIPVSYLDYFEQALPNMVGRRIIEEAGHLIAWDQPEAVASLVSEVLGS